MKEITFEDLARLPMIRDYETMFRKATGVTLKLVAPAPLPDSPRQEENPFCTMICGCADCVQTHATIQRNAARKMAQDQAYCFAGMTIVAVPVVIGGRHAATFLTGQIFRREPTERDFALVVKMLASGRSPQWEKQARRAYFEIPVFTAERFQAVLNLVNVFAKYVADYASQSAIARATEEPVSVRSAKEFMEAHVEQTVRLQEVAQHVHVSPFHLCKLFKKATGMTLTEYITRVRLEKAKKLLADPSMRVTEVVYAAGFGSIPQFNSVFKRYVGMAPTEYRVSLKSEPLG